MTPDNKGRKMKKPLAILFALISACMATSCYSQEPKFGPRAQTGTIFGSTITGGSTLTTSTTSDLMSDTPECNESVTNTPCKRRYSSWEIVHSHQCQDEGTCMEMVTRP